MEYVLVDIKNFLRKLENGQLEIEAGQWELHKALSGMNRVMSDLQNLKEDVEDMRLNSMQQMGLIKELQVQLDRLNKIQLEKLKKRQEEDQPVTVSESSVQYDRIYSRTPESQGFKKRPCRLRSDEITEITSQVSNEKTDSGEGESREMVAQGPVENEGTEFTTNGNDQISDEESCRNEYKTEAYLIPKINHNKGHFGVHPANDDMLQRYLKDSIKYIERKVSSSSQNTQHSCRQSEVDKKTHSSEYTPFWDEYSSRGPPEPACEKRNAKENSTETDIPPDSVLSRRFLCPKCPKQFLTKADSIRHERKHRPVESFYCETCGKVFERKDELKEHEQIHRTSRSFKGFRCSYCGKICSSPEKLTTHLRNCRIIMKAHYKKK